MFSQFDPEICKKRADDAIIAAIHHINAGRRDQFHISGKKQEETRVIAEIQDKFGGVHGRLDSVETSNTEYQRSLNERLISKVTASDVRATSLDEAEKAPGGDGRTNSPHGTSRTKLGGRQKEASKHQSLCRWISEKLCINGKGGKDEKGGKGDVCFAKDGKAEE
ncbi:hypothetical protein HYALB_00000502 [Hymenoscyphus albidus]|uniref:Uncharacterized protein n=1 Tax=Hymenoscyphus albidus TaxID=595503 RepID=A0A9N9LLV6_9HELO|nr:hypothetical protein HYALB_00000502 [Hymenoscyphus albidus]